MVSRKLFMHVHFLRNERRVHIPWVRSNSVQVCVKSMEHAMFVNAAEIDRTVTRPFMWFTRSRLAY